MSVFDNLFAAAGMPLLSDYSGVPFTYLPRDGGRREIVVICGYDETAAANDETTERRQERLWVAVWRDPETGIDAPQLGDSGLRDEDADDSPWSFQGEIRNASAWAWELLFARNRPQRYGPR